MLLICAFVFTYAKSRFSHDMAQLSLVKKEKEMKTWIILKFALSRGI